MSQYDAGGSAPRVNTPRPNPPRKKPSGDADWGSWLLIAIMFATGLWPIGLFLLVKKLSDGSRKPKTSGSSAPRQTPAAPAQTNSMRSQLARTPQYSAKGCRTMRIIGIVLAALGVLGILNVLRSYGVYLSWWWFEELFYPTGLALGGVGLLLGSRSMQRRARRFGKYLACAGKRRVVPIAELAQAAEVSERKAEKDLELMVEKGLWGEGAYVDAGGDMLFRSQEDAEAYRIDRRAAEEPAEPTQAEEGYSGVLRSIRRANDRIADPVLSQKIDRLEEIAGRIFRIIEDEPSKRAQASTFLNYYLPTTQKLLDSYADFEEAGVSGKNLDQAKDKIARTMDNIVAGFEQQLDRLYQSEAMDIDSDIRVMETMLRRDRGTVEDDFGLGGGTAVQSEDEEF